MKPLIDKWAQLFIMTTKLAWWEKSNSSVFGMYPVMGEHNALHRVSRFTAKREATQLLSLRLCHN